MTERAGSKATKSRRIERWMRKRGWGYDTPRNGLRRRVLSLASDRHPWWDWGHRLMILTGDDASGNWGEPTPTTWWYRLGTPRRMTRTGYPIHPLRSIQIVTDYKEFRALTEGLDEDEMYQWKAIGTNQDGELVLGKQWWGGPFFGLSS